MEASGSGIDWKTRSNVCRCCLAPGCYKDLSSTYFCSGQREVYADMLKDTFNIELSYQEGAGPSSCSRLICEECIVRLRDAASFKQQALCSEASIASHLAAVRCDLVTVVAPQPESSANESSKALVKSEPETDVGWESDVRLSFDESLAIEGYESFDDDEILANVKMELAKEQCATLMEKKQGPRKSLRSGKKIKHCQEDIDGKHQKQPKDWSKIAERRGNGPILRENSLKLIANSTMCVFQWNKSRYRCFCCKEPFSDMATLRDHTGTHTLKNIEKKIIIQQNRLVKVEITDLHCKICSKSVQDLTSLRSHLSSVHGLKFLIQEDLLVPFKLGSDLQCQLCSEEFTVFRLLNIHMNRHYQKQVCHICGAGFSNLVFLNLHKTRSHRALKCNQCELEFASRSEKKRHEVESHGLKVERKLRFPCPFCNERFFQENFKVKHMVDKHGMAKPDHKCSLCLKTFLTKSLKNNHVKNVHLKEKKRECDICHMRFYTKSDVSRHRVTHTGEKNYECNVCSNMFATRDSLRRHLKRTHGSLT